MVHQSKLKPPWQRRKNRPARTSFALRSAALAWIALGQVAGALLPMPAEAARNCWPADELAKAHQEQGDEILLTYDSMMRDGSVTVIYRDPADGVVTTVGFDMNGMACIFDVGRTPTDTDGRPGSKTPAEG